MKEVKDIIEKFDTQQVPLLHLAKMNEELGEYAEALLDVRVDWIDKDKTEDDLFGESIDVIVCAYALLHSTFPDKSSEEIQEMVVKKTQKWERKLIAKNP